MTGPDGGVFFRQELDFDVAAPTLQLGKQIAQRQIAKPDGSAVPLRRAICEAQVMASGMRRFLLAGSLAAAMLTGCVQPGRFVHIHHHRPAEYAVPPGVQRLAVAPFVGRSADDEKWGRVALAELAKALAGAEPELQ